MRTRPNVRIGWSKSNFEVTATFGAKRPFIRKTAFGPVPRQMVFEQTIEEDIVGSTGVVKGGSAPPLLPRPAHPLFDLASGQPEIAEHAVVQIGELGRSAAGSQFSFDGSFHDRHKRQYSRNEASHDRTRPPPVAARRCRGFHRAMLSSAFPFPFSPVLHFRNDRRSLAMSRWQTPSVAVHTTRL